MRYLYESYRGVTDEIANAEIVIENAELYASELIEIARKRNFDFLENFNFEDLEEIINIFRAFFSIIKYYMKKDNVHISNENLEKLKEINDLDDVLSEVVDENDESFFEELDFNDLVEIGNSIFALTNMTNEILSSTNTRYFNHLNG